MNLSKSKIFLILLLCFIGGVGIHSFFDVSFFWIYVLGLVSLTGLIVGWRVKKFRIIALGGIFLFLGILRYNLSLPQIDSSAIQFYNEKDKITFVGIVDKEPDVRSDHVKLTVDARKIVDEVEKDISGNVLVKANLYPEYNYGDELKIICSLKQPGQIDDFDYERYLARYNIYSTCYYPRIELLSQNKGNRFYGYILSFKNKLQQAINSGLAEPQASILSAMLLGSRRGIPQELVDQFSQTGTSHIIAISGLHITIVSAILMTLALGIGLSRKKAFYFSLLFLALFIVMIGMPASAVRAGMMGGLVLLAMKLGRLNKATNALVLVASVMLLANPKILRGDVGFQLSFLAVLGLIFILPFFEKWLEKLPSSLGIKDSVQMTLSAQITTLPLIIFSFQRLSFIAPIANILILPILPFILIAGFLSSFVGLVFLPLAKLLFLPVWLLLAYLIKIIEFFAGLPFSFVEIQGLSGVVLVIIYVGMGWGIWKLRNLKIK